MSNYMNISQKLEECRNQIENLRKNIKDLANELKPIFIHHSELENRITENNRIIDTFLTSIKNTCIYIIYFIVQRIFQLVDYNNDKLNEVMYERSLEDLSKNILVSLIIL